MEAAGSNGSDPLVLAEVAGRTCSRSNEDMEHACLVLLAEEQEKGEFSNSALVAALSDMVRLIREYSDAMNRPSDTEVDTHASILEGILDDAAKAKMCDMDIFVAWNLGVSAFRGAKVIGAKFPHDNP